MRQNLDQMRVAGEVDVLRVVDKLGESAPVGLRGKVAEGALVLAAGLHEIARPECGKEMAPCCRVWRTYRELIGRRKMITRTTGMKRRMAKSTRWLRVAVGRVWQSAAKRLSKALWDRCAPNDLLGNYKKWLCESGGVGNSSGIGLLEMLDSLVDTSSLKRCGNQGGGGSGRACVIPKNSDKCSFILNSMKMNGSDSCSPPHIVLPQLFVIAEETSGVYD